MRRLILLLFSGVVAVSAAAQSKSEVDRFQKAMALLRSNPPQVEKARGLLEKLTANSPEYCRCLGGLGRGLFGF